MKQRSLARSVESLSNNKIKENQVINSLIIGIVKLGGKLLVY